MMLAGMIFIILCMLTVGITEEIRISHLEKELAERRSELKTAGGQLQDIVELFDDSQDDLAELNILKRISAEQTLNSGLLSDITEALSSRIWLTQIKTLGGSELTELEDKYSKERETEAEKNSSEGNSGSDTEDLSAEQYFLLLNDISVYLQTEDNAAGSKEEENNAALQHYDLLLQGESRKLASVTSYCVYLRELSGIERVELLDCRAVQEAENSSAKLVHFRIWISCRV